jgi:hypothetical protein
MLSGGFLVLFTVACGFFLYQGYTSFMGEKWLELTGWTILAIGSGFLAYCGYFTMLVGMIGR